MERGIHNLVGFKRWGIIPGWLHPSWKGSGRDQGPGGASQESAHGQELGRQIEELIISTAETVGPVQTGGSLDSPPLYGQVVRSSSQALAYWVILGLGPGDWLTESDAEGWGLWPASPTSTDWALWRVSLSGCNGGVPLPSDTVCGPGHRVLVQTHAQFPYPTTWSKYR